MCARDKPAMGDPFQCREINAKHIARSGGFNEAVYRKEGRRPSGSGRIIARLLVHPGYKSSAPWLSFFQSRCGKKSFNLCAVVLTACFAHPELRLCNRDQFFLNRSILHSSFRAVELPGLLVKLFAEVITPEAIIAGLLLWYS